MKEPFRVGITPDFTPQAAACLEKALEELLSSLVWEYMPDTGPAASPEVLDRYDAVIALGLRFPAESLQGLRRLAVIARWGVGYERIDVEACTRNGVLVAITPEAVRRPVAEGILAFILALAKNLPTLDRLCRSGRWRQEVPWGWNVQGKTLGSVGAGNIARELFRLARAVGFGRLLACDPYAAAFPEGVEPVDLEALLRESDFVTINCPLTQETRGLIGARQLDLMKATAFLINTARGPIVQQQALVDALQRRRIAGAALDVFEMEPVAPDDPILSLENVIVTPHAVAWTQELFRDNSLYACRNVLRVSQGQVPETVVNGDVLERPAGQARLARWRTP